MKHAWTLMLINAALAVVLGLGFVAVPERMLELLPFFSASPHSGPVALLRLLGILLSGLGLALWILPPLQLDPLRRVLLTVLPLLFGVVWIYLPLASWDTGLERPGVERSAERAREALNLCGIILLLGGWAFAVRYADPTSAHSGLDSLGESAAQQERNRLARDLHDSIKQQLFSIKLSSAAAEERWESDPEGARTALADVRRSSQEAMVEMRALLTQLRPEPLATVGLVEALREQCKALGYRCAIPVDFEIGDLPPDDRLPAAAQENLFRIAQEALSNVAHHGRARSVQVRLGQIDQEGSPSLLLRVRDDGQGFDPASRPTGMGLRNMRERLEAAGGTLDVESAPGQGTEVRARMPLIPPKALAEELKKAALWTAQMLILALIMEGPRLVPPLLALYLVAAWRKVTKQTAGQAEHGSAPGIGLRLIGHQHRFILLVLAFWWTCTIVPNASWDQYWELGIVTYRLQQVVRFVAPLSLVLALREVWGLFRLLRSLDGPPPEPVLPWWLFTAMLLVFLVSLPCLFLLPVPEDVTRTGVVSYAILYLSWWLKTLP